MPQKRHTVWSGSTDPRIGSQEIENKLRFENNWRDKGNVDLLSPDTPVNIPKDLQVTANSLGQIIQSLQAKGIQPEQLPFGKPYRLDECGWVANRWCELLQLPLELKQRLMALENPLVRLELVHDILVKAGISGLES